MVFVIEIFVVQKQKAVTVNTLINGVTTIVRATHGRNCDALRLVCLQYKSQPIGLVAFKHTAK